MRRDPVEALPRDDGFILMGDTYPMRAAIKAVGGQWRPEKKSWFVTAEAFDTLKAGGAAVQKLTRVLLSAHCCNPEEETYVNETDLKRGKTRRGCSRCDTPERCGRDVEILRIVEENPGA